MNESILVRPLADGAFEYTQIGAGIDFPESLSDLSWEMISLSELANQVKNNSDVLVQLVLPDELCIGSRVLPVSVLARGGWKWLRAVRNTLGEMELFWTRGAVAGRTRAHVPVPFLVNPNAPGVRALMLIALLAVIGFGFLGYVSSKNNSLEQEYEMLGMHIEELRKGALETQEKIKPPTTSLGPLDQVQAMRGWASWLSTNVLRLGAESGTIVQFSASWDPPLNLQDIKLPRHLGWQLKLKQISAAGLHRLAQGLDEIGLGPQEIQLEEIQGLQMTYLGDKPVVIRGSYPLSGNETPEK